MFEFLEYGWCARGGLMSRTISEILEEYEGFDKAFWASYSVSFSTLEFLLKNDFSQVMETNYLHLICDANQLNKSLDELHSKNIDISRLLKLQEYCTVSHQLTEGAFHPKILILSSKTKILILVSSANATSSGILLNQDLICEFYYDEKHTDTKVDVSAIFQYVKSFDGWCAEALEDLSVVEDDFSFLKEKLHSDVILTIPNTSSLFDQMKSKIDIVGLTCINVFSPFFDDNFSAIDRIAETYNVPINIFTPIKELVTTRKEKLPNNVRFFHSNLLKKKTFHAKFYDFNYGDNSTVFWGSANCSFSGLLSPNRNYEVLIKSDFNKTDMDDLWGDIINLKSSQVQYDVTIEHSNTSKEKPAIYIKDVSFYDNEYIIRLENRCEHGIQIKGICYKDETHNIKITNIADNVITANSEEKGMVIVYVVKNEEKYSNYAYINNAYALYARICGTKHTTVKKHKDTYGKSSIEETFSLFNIDNDKPIKHAARSNNHRNGFWRMPIFQPRKTFSGLIDLNAYIHKRKQDLSGNNSDDDNSGASELKTRTSKPYASTYFDLLTKESKKLVNNIIFLTVNKKFEHIDITRWVSGVQLITRNTLDYLDSVETLPKDLDNILPALNGISIFCAWVLIYAKKMSLEYDEVLDLLRCVQDVSLGLTLYKYLYAQRFTTSNLSSDIDNEQILNIKRALYIRHTLDCEFIDSENVSEHRQLTISNILNKLSNTNIALKTTDYLSDITSLYAIKNIEEVVVYTNNIESFILIKKTDASMLLESLLGVQKNYSPDGPLIKICISSVSGM